MNPKELPIHEIAPALNLALGSGNRMVIQAPTGSGKSTQIPQFLADHPAMAGREIIVLQPRRLPARMLAKRVAWERGVDLGGEVGYQVRFDSRRSRETRICFITEAILLRRMMDDPELKGVGAVVFDEFHERHLYADVSLVCCKRLQETLRPDLRLVVMSATLQTEGLQAYLESSTLLQSEGRTFPVTEEFLEEEDTIPVWEAAALELGRAVRRGCEGDVLIFMPGAYEINRTIQEVRMLQENKNWLVLPLHGELPPQQQDAAMEESATRKVIVSTNVAETSLTIDGIRLVIDSGLARVARFDPHRGINTLVIDKISRASAEQRKGRAGRTAPGHCMRLWAAHDHRNRAVAELPEIKRVDLAEICLTLLGAGHDPAAFEWFEAPLENSLKRALVLLEDLGAMEAGAITELGRRMLAFPVHPRFSRLLIEAGQRGCVRPAALIAALCQGRSILQRADSPQMRERREDVLGGEGRSDFFQHMRAHQYAARVNFRVEECRKLGIHAQSASQAGQLQERFLEIARKQGIPIEQKAADEASIRRSVLAAFSDQVARLVDGGTLRCELVHGRRGSLARDSVVREAGLMVASEINEIEGRDKELNVILNQVTEIEEDWLRELQPGAFRDRHEVRWDPVVRKVLAERVVVFRDLVLRREAAAVPPPEQAASLLARAVQDGKCPLTHWDDAVESWIVRLNCLAAWCPEYELPPVTREDRLALLEQICHGGYSYKDIKDRPVAPVVHGWLSPSQRDLLDRMAPDRIELPGGRKARIVYGEGKDPVVASRIQDLFGLQEAPKVAGGKIGVTVEILAPNMRAVQMTRDLKNFWAETYPQIKPELARRYPKHRWI
ncbi:MAG: ATP-dependent helicase HrpB [Candidatus Methylacidiphilales bacterium]|nr:ATP-dependent helicase HrpB [Candidatus Methylacidiphilales bacterium]